jgi:hypothetical protein
VRRRLMRRKWAEHELEPPPSSTALPRHHSAPARALDVTGWQVALLAIRLQELRRRREEGLIGAAEYEEHKDRILREI